MRPEDARRIRAVLLEALDTTQRAGGLVKGLLDHGAQSTLIGPYGSGKSFVALDLAFCVALGRPWFGHAIEPGLVVYLALEGQGRIARRAAAFLKHHNIDPVGVPLAFITTAIDLRNETGRDRDDVIKAVLNTADQLDRIPRLIIVDTVSRALGDDENSQKDVGAFMRNVASIADETGAHVLLVHHLGKDTGRGSRGSTVLPAALDTELTIEAGGLGVRNITATKQRDAPDDFKVAFALTSVEIGRDEDGEPITSCIVTPAEPISEPKRSPLSDRQTVALRALQDLAADGGEPLPAAWDIAAGLHGVRLDQWRQKLADLDMLSGGNPRSQFANLRDGLLKKSAIGIHNETVWPCRTL